MPARLPGQRQLPGIPLHNHAQARQPLVHRFWRYVDVSAGADACWAWTGAHSRKRGRAGNTRPVLWHQGKILIAARVALWLRDDPFGLDPTGYAGPVHPDAPAIPLLACHCCPQGENAQCVNPKHLYWGTAAENIRDRYSRDALLASAAAVCAATFAAPASNTGTH